MILIPLGDATPASVSLLLQARFPAWSLVQCRLWAKYLGFVLGPERGERAWEQALAKALARARLWAQVALGLQFAALVYKVYVSSILGFLLQLERLPSSWQTVEASLFRALVPGPFRWCAAADLHGLRQDFSFPQEFVDLREVSLAARFRVTQLEAAPQGGLGVRSWLRRLAAAEHRSERIRRLACWRSWFADSYCHSLAAAVRELREADITPPVVQLRAARATSRPLTRQQVHRADKHTQRAVGELLRERQRRCPEARMRQSWRSGR